MPSWTLAELMSAATTRAGRRAEIPQSTVSSIVNEAYQEVVATGDFASLESINVSSSTSGDSRITKPFEQLIDISLTWSWSTSTSVTSNHRVLRRMSPSQTDAEGYLPVGCPVGYVDYGAFVEFWPSFDSAYSIQFRGYAPLSDMTDTAAVPSIATDARKGILLKAIQIIHEHTGNPTAANLAQNEYLNYMSRLKTDKYKRDATEASFGLTPVTGSNYRQARTRRDYFDLESF